MPNKTPNYSYKIKLKRAGIILLITGAILGYAYCGTEAQKTIGGFLCGTGLAIFLSSLCIKSSKY